MISVRQKETNLIDCARARILLSMNSGIDGSYELREVLASGRVDPLLHVCSIKDVPEGPQKCAHFYNLNVL